jgi:hypothetical protein
MAKQEPGPWFHRFSLQHFCLQKKGHGYHHHPLQGGPSKRMIKSHPSFELTRRNNKEFGGRSTASKWIRRFLYPLKPMSDYNISGPLNWFLYGASFTGQQEEYCQKNQF